MDQHRFRVGQVVQYCRPRADAPAPSREYKILELLPTEGREHFYRIKTITERLDRVAKESEIAPSAKCHTYGRILQLI